MKGIALRFDAPLISFGAPIVDNYGFVGTFPARSMLAGLLANAFGYDHRDHERTRRLQRRIRFAARIDVEGREIVDYQTVGLGQSFLVDTGWTTWGRIEGRTGASGEETHIRYRHYRAGSISTVVLTLDPVDEDPNLENLEAALSEPARPLFIGRKCCIPSGPILLCRWEAETLLEALKGIDPAGEKRALRAQWPDEEGLNEPESRRLSVMDERDWENQIHGGERFVRQGFIRIHGGEV